jgi:hypothetical protein
VRDGCLVSAQKEKCDVRRRISLVGPGLFLMAFLASCNSGSSPTGPSGEADVYPRYIDANSDQVNDDVEAGTHDPGTPGGHSFIDANGDGVCDYAQNGSATWHGPGFVDEDGNGICDRWESGSPMRNQSGGLEYRDDNHNGVNDYVESFHHGQVGHAFVDSNGDGICDLAQNGSPTWHGPGYVDANGDGVPDTWQPGGMGYGQPGNHGSMNSGGMHH